METETRYPCKSSQYDLQVTDEWKKPSVSDLAGIERVVAEYIKEHNGCDEFDVAVWLCLSLSRVCEITDRLVEKGVIERG